MCLLAGVSCIGWHLVSTDPRFAFFSARAASTGRRHPFPTRVQLGGDIAQSGLHHGLDLGMPESIICLALAMSAVCCRRLRAVAVNRPHKRMKGGPF